jgi:hypothetical protein
VPQEETSARAVETYDHINRLLERTVDIGDDGTIEQTLGFSYEGRFLTSWESADTNVTMRKTYEYDRYGRILRLIEDDNTAIGDADRMIEFTHHCRTQLAEDGP